jgi:Zn-dependent M16 (insulinase) family peptidase
MRTVRISRKVQEGKVESFLKMMRTKIIRSLWLRDRERILELLANENNFKK